MCGRTVVSLGPADVCKACSYKDKQGKRVRPQWRDAPGGQQYYTSYNVAPGSHTPVMLSSKHFKGKEGEEVTTERVVQPMQWGLVPSWHKGDPKKVQFNMSNCRGESMNEKRSFKVPLGKGRRCVVLAEGFFEWQRKGSQKQPYYIYFPQPDSAGVKAEIKEEIKEEKEDDEDDERVGKRLLTMAGVFDVWHSPEGKDLYTYSVITVKASKSMDWLHDRMPAILQNDEEIQRWLDFGDVPLKDAVSLIRPTETIELHPVSTLVNNSRNSTPDCIEPIVIGKPKETAGSAMMKSWLKKGKVKSEVKSDSETSDTSEKKPKSSKGSSQSGMMKQWLTVGKREPEEKCEGEPASKRPRLP